MSQSAQTKSRWTRRTLTALASAAIACIGVTVAAAPASAATIGTGSLTVTRLSNNALTISYNGHTYTCYYGDLCIYRGGYQTYYVCQTPTNSYTGTGWAINNQYGSGATTNFYPRNGASQFNLAGQHESGIDWYYVKSFRTCV